MSGMRKVEKEPLVHATFLDRFIGYFSPQIAADRVRGRATYNALTGGGYRSRDRSRRMFRSWGLSSGSADAELNPSLVSLRSDSRDLLRNAPLATGAINTVVTNVIGTGLKPQAQVDVDVLKEVVGLDDDQIEKFERDAEREFRYWSKAEICDASKKQNFNGLLDLAFRSVLESGDLFVVRRMKSPGPKRYGTSLKFIEADRVANPKNGADTAKISAGVEHDEDGAPIKYHIFKRHPGDKLAHKDMTASTPVSPTFTNGEWQVLHLFRRLRPEQTRGIPYLAPVIEIFKSLDRYTEAEITAAVISGMYTVFHKTGGGQGVGALAEESSSQDSDEEIRLGSGTILEMGPEDEVEFANPLRPNTAFDPFVLAILRQIGAALEIPFEILIKHFGQSFSASQGAILEAWKFFKARRFWLAENFADPVWEAVITEAVARGYIDAPGFFSSPIIRAAYLGVEWIGPPRGVIDPVKEAKANEIAEDRSWKTAGGITSELYGGEFEKNVARRGRETELRAQNKVSLPSKQATGPAPKPSSEPEEDDQGDDPDKNND